jgi:cytidylate kinase
MESKKLDHAAAKAEIARFDSSIIKFLKRYFKAEFEDPVFYDLVVNTERISYEDAAAIAIDTLAVRNKTSPP